MPIIPRLVRAQAPAYRASPAHPRPLVANAVRSKAEEERRPGLTTGQPLYDRRCNRSVTYLEACHTPGRSHLFCGEGGPGRPSVVGIRRPYQFIDPRCPWAAAGLWGE